MELDVLCILYKTQWSCFLYSTPTCKDITVYIYIYVMVHTISHIRIFFGYTCDLPSFQVEASSPST